jgi:hypothetical protein
MTFTRSIGCAKHKEYDFDEKYNILRSQTIDSCVRGLNGCLSHAIRRSGHVELNPRHNTLDAQVPLGMSPAELLAAGVADELGVQQARQAFTARLHDLVVVPRKDRPGNRREQIKNALVCGHIPVVLHSGDVPLLRKLPPPCSVQLALCYTHDHVRLFNLYHARVERELVR